jgi:hypothetical protein
VRLSPDRIDNVDDLVKTSREALAPNIAERVSRAIVVGAELVTSSNRSIAETSRSPCCLAETPSSRPGSGKFLRRRSSEQRPLLRRALPSAIVGPEVGGPAGSRSESFAEGRRSRTAITSFTVAGSRSSRSKGRGGERAAVGCADLTPHDLRRSFARHAARSGVPVKTMMEIGGWRTLSTWARYCIVDEADPAAALSRVSS